MAVYPSQKGVTAQNGVSANQFAERPLVSLSRGRATNSIWRRDCDFSGFLKERFRGLSEATKQTAEKTRNVSETVIFIDFLLSVWQQSPFKHLVGSGAESKNLTKGGSFISAKANLFFFFFIVLHRLFVASCLFHSENYQRKIECEKNFGIWKLKILVSKFCRSITMSFWTKQLIKSDQV